MSYYCSVDDVLTLGVHGIEEFSDTSTPTSDQVDFLMEKVYNDMNSRLFAAGVQIPVDSTNSPNAFSLLKTTQAYGVASEIQKYAYTTNKRLENVKGVQLFIEEYVYRIKMYCDYPAYLIDATRTINSDNLRTADGSPLWSYNITHYNFDTNDSKSIDYLEPIVRIDYKF